MSTKDEIFDYVMNSPEDTNPSVLRSMLNDLEAPMQEKFIITLTKEDWYEDPWTSDKTFSEIKEAYEQNKQIFVYARNQLISLSGVGFYREEPHEFQFFTYCYSFKGDENQIVGIYIDPNEISVAYQNFYTE